MLPHKDRSNNFGDFFVKICYFLCEKTERVIKEEIMIIDRPVTNKKGKESILEMEITLILQSSFKLVFINYYNN